MKQIEGKKYYISVGYIKEELMQDKIDAKDIISLAHNYEVNELYIDDSGESTIIIPLIEVDNIENAGKNLMFNKTLNADSLGLFENKESTEPINSINVVGLFSIFKENREEQVEHIGFFKTVTENLTPMKPITISIEVPTYKILGE